MAQSTQCPSRSRLLLEDVFATSVPRNTTSMPLNARDKRPIAPALVLDAHIPISFWRTGWIFKNIEDMRWRDITAEARTEIFPKTLRTEHRTHPGYVLKEVGNFALQICPCSTKGDKGPFIPEGVRLQATNELTTVRSFVVIRCASTIPRDSSRVGKRDHWPLFRGIFPPDQLQYTE